MEFRLTYEGYLPSSGNRHEKHAIRRQFHPQLRKLWKEHRALEHKWEIMPRIPLDNPGAKKIDRFLRERGYINNVPGIDEVEMLARDFSRCGYRFVPLVNKRFDLVCGLNILFLRRGDPGNLVMPGGDVDNRMKILIDALKMPERTTEVEPPSEDEDPFFCLVEDDALITDLNITTDRLLKPDLPRVRGHEEHDVLVVIQVILKATKITFENLQLMA